MAKSISLGEFERRHGIHKGTVSKRAREMGFDTSAGLSSEAYEAMQREFDVKVEFTPDRPTVDVGNNRRSLALPQQPSTLDLGAYRGENSALTSFEPEDIDRFLAACDGFVEAVNADFAYQQAVTQQKEAAVAKVRSKVEQVKQAQLLYQVRSEALSLHNRGLDADLKEGLSTLGKPTEPDTAA